MLLWLPAISCYPPVLLQERNRHKSKALLFEHPASFFCIIIYSIYSLGLYPPKVHPLPGLAASCFPTKTTSLPHQEPKPIGGSRHGLRKKQKRRQAVGPASLRCKVRILLYSWNPRIPTLMLFEILEDEIVTRELLPVNPAGAGLLKVNTAGDRFLVQS